MLFSINYLTKYKQYQTIILIKIGAVFLSFIRLMLNKYSIPLIILGILLPSFLLRFSDTDRIDSVLVCSFAL